MLKSNPFLLRPITAADQDFLWEMLYQAIYVPQGSPPPQREIVRVSELARYVQDWPLPGDFGLLAVDAASQQPAGAVWLRLFSADNPGYGFIDEKIPELSAAILPRYRGQGLGTQLLRAVLAQAEDRCPAVCLSVSLENPALRLYHQLGFEIHHAADASLVMKKDWVPLWAEIFHHPELNIHGRVIRREAVRGIIQDGSRGLMVFSAQNGDYKFPGGGVQPGESHEQALVREIKEECGAVLTQAISPAGKVIEYDLPIEVEFDVFKMTSYYYRCRIDGELGALNLDEYEQELGFLPVWVELETAIQTNLSMVENPSRSAPRWTRRDLLVLQKIRC